MAKQSGTNGAFSWDSGDVAMTGFTLTTSEPILDTTDSDNAGWKTRIAKGISEWSAVINGFIDDTLPAAGDTATAIFTLDTAVTLTGTGFIESVERAVDVPGDSPNLYTLNLIGSGALS